MSPLPSLFLSLLVAILSVQRVEMLACPAPPPCYCDKLTIYCNYKGFTTVPNFQHSEFYTTLLLEGNAIKEIPDNAFHNLPNLITILFGINNLTRIHPNAFHGIPHLAILFLSNNQLQTLPDTVFDPLTELSVLFLYNNNLTDFPVKSLAKAVGGRKMFMLNLQKNTNLPCNVKEEVLSQIRMPEFFVFPSPCGFVPTV